MARKTFTTTIEEGIQTDFKKACSAQTLDMNDVLEAFMKDFIRGKYYIEKEINITLKHK